MSRHSVAVIDQQNAEWNRLERQIGINSQLYNENRTDKSSRRGQYEAWTGSIHPKSPTLNGEASRSGFEDCSHHESIGTVARSSFWDVGWLLGNLTDCLGVLWSMVMDLG
ncbi:hypothetical protein D5086_005166 [Populus alba]|uniref:Uncharacterized protein n=1 Tax=Populus alba TaxID=43335 RepID=A0ACC4CTT0_POPAL